MVALGLAALVAWTGRPPRASGGHTTTIRVPAARVPDAERAVEAVFAQRGVTVDTLELTPRGDLRVVLARGTYVSPARFEHAGAGDVSCTAGTPAGAPLAATAAVASRAFGRGPDLTRVVVVTRGDSAVRGGWFWRARCGPSTGTTPFGLALLDSVRAAS